MIKNIFVTLLLYLFAVVSNAQERKWTSAVNAGAGAFRSEMQAGNIAKVHSSGITLKCGYSISYNLSKSISLSTGINMVYDKTDEPDALYDPYVNEDEFAFLSIPLLLQYKIHLKRQNRYFVLGIGPSLNIMAVNDKNQFDYGPKTALNKKDKFKTFNVGVQPGIMFHWGKNEIGLEGNIGLTNVKKNYGLDNRKLRFLHLWPTYRRYF